MKTMRYIMTVFLALGVAACGNGGQTPRTGVELPPPEILPATWTHFEGVWQGTLSRDDKVVENVIALANGWGETRILLNKGQLVGFLSVSRGSVSGTITAIASVGARWRDQSRIADMVVEGTYFVNRQLDIRFAGGGESGRLELKPVAGSSTWRTPADVEGQWVLRDGNQNIIASFLVESRDELTAGFTGSHVNGCMLAGTIGSWTSVFSYDLSSIEVSGCPLYVEGDVNGTYIGTGASFDLGFDEIDDERFVIALSNSEYELTLLLEPV